MENPLIRLSDDDLELFCLQAATIVTSKEFKQLFNEMHRIYRKLHVNEAKVSAFKDSLFSLYLEVYADQYSCKTNTYKA